MKADSAGGSVTLWIKSLKTGDEGAARSLWHRYFGLVVRLARGRLRNVPCAASDDEDVALSAIHCLYRGVSAGRFPQLADRESLWRLLAIIVAQKAVDQRRHLGRAKRGHGRTVGAVDLATGRAQGDAMSEVVDRAPSPADAAVLDEDYQYLLNRLEDDELRRVAVWKVEGHENDEIARRLGCGLRTVERKLGVIRAIWLAEVPT
jgi:DNA-directed RNA polymerase specialized sigma24 family protein